MAVPHVTTVGKTVAVLGVGAGHHLALDHELGKAAHHREHPIGRRGRGIAVVHAMGEARDVLLHPAGVAEVHAVVAKGDPAVVLPVPLVLVGAVPAGVGGGPAHAPAEGVAVHPHRVGLVEVAVGGRGEVLLVGPAAGALVARGLAGGVDVDVVGAEVHAEHVDVGGGGGGAVGGEGHARLDGDAVDLGEAGGMREGEEEAHRDRRLSRRGAPAPGCGLGGAEPGC
jgi:hypothetical protein